MAREINEILQELKSVADNLEELEYVKEASDLRNLTDMVRTGGKIERRVRKVSAENPQPNLSSQ